MTVCLRDGCEKPLPEIAVANLDPFCSRACACAHYGTEFPPPEKVRRPVGPSHGMCSSHKRMLKPPSEPQTPLQRVRLQRDRLARARIAEEARA